MSDAPTWEVFAVKYARHERPASANFIGGDPHDGPMPLDFYVWAVRGNGRVFVVDLGFNAETARRRQRELIRDPVDGLALLGIDAAAVEDVVVTHFHYDHVGTTDRFPRAALPHPGQGDDLRDGPPHGAAALCAGLCRRGRDRHAARGLSRPRRLP